MATVETRSGNQQRRSAKRNWPTSSSPSGVGRRQQRHAPTCPSAGPSRRPARSRSEPAEGGLGPVPPPAHRSGRGGRRPRYPPRSRRGGPAHAPLAPGPPPEPGRWRPSGPPRALRSACRGCARALRCPEPDRHRGDGRSASRRVGRERRRKLGLEAGDLAAELVADLDRFGGGVGVGERLKVLRREHRIGTEARNVGAGGGDDRELSRADPGPLGPPQARRWRSPPEPGLPRSPRRRRCRSPGRFRPARPARGGRRRSGPC